MAGPINITADHGETCTYAYASPAITGTYTSIPVRPTCSNSDRWARGAHRSRIESVIAPATDSPVTAITDTVSVDTKSPPSVVVGLRVWAAHPASPSTRQRVPVQITHLSQGLPTSPSRQTKTTTIADKGPRTTAAKIPGKKLTDTSR